MRRVVAPKIKFFYVDALDSQKRLQIAYSRIFTIAKQNILKRKEAKNSEPIYKRVDQTNATL